MTEFFSWLAMLFLAWLGKTLLYFSMFAMYGTILLFLGPIALYAEGFTMQDTTMFYLSCGAVVVDILLLAAVADGIYRGEFELLGVVCGMLFMLLVIAAMAIAAFDGQSFMQALDGLQNCRGRRC
ncbi:MAG: hypothetical protein WAX89_01930 [Alphaproteobacteria bacterium]